MTHSTLTWFSGSIEPKNSNDQFSIAIFEKEVWRIFPVLFEYNKEERRFEYDHSIRVYLSNEIYWACVPIVLDLKQEGKQSQVPEEK